MWDVSKKTYIKTRYGEHALATSGQLDQDASGVALPDLVGSAFTALG